MVGTKAALAATVVAYLRTQKVGMHCERINSWQTCSGLFVLFVAATRPASRAPIPW